MTKKRRECDNEECYDLRSLSGYWVDEIAIKTDSFTQNDVTEHLYHLIPKYGTGTLTCYISEDIEITVSKYQLHKNVVYAPILEKSILHICFLIKGEKIIYIDDQQQIFYESQESYMAAIDHFKGYNKILSNKPFKEIRIAVPKDFLINHGFVNEFEFKKLNDEKLILPITEELLNTLLHIENKDSDEKVNRLYLRAKVFELIALQIELYKKNDKNPLKTNQNKILNKLFDVKNRIKSTTHKQLTLHELGEELGMTGHMLNKEFCRVFGYSIHEFTLAEKMNQAKLLLENTDKMIYQIAEEVGYKNATHFTAAFKKQLGVTPKQYKKSL